jgi:hypothetical protein
MGPFRVNTAQGRIDRNLLKPLVKYFEIDFSLITLSNGQWILNEYLK